jgi:hypothetical protein
VGTTRRKQNSASKASPSAGHRRKIVVFISLVGVLTLTSALLLALAPAPLSPEASSSLFAVDAPKSFDALFDTAAPVGPGRWRYVYVHHSQTPSGSAQSLSSSPAGLADHFVIGNGDGCADGEIQIGQRWTQQLPAAVTPGLDSIRPDCISICVVGDFSHARPTATQERRLIELVSVLQGKLKIPGTSVWFDTHSASPAGVGRYFPAAEFRNRILP